MRALLYDVHGNLPALEAVLADARTAGADSWLLGGDHSAFGGEPDLVLARLGELEDAVWLRGNWERWAVEGAPDPALDEAVAVLREAIDEDERERLAGLPQSVLVDGLCCCHGSPSSDVVTILPTPAAGDSELLEAIAAETVVVGHSHLAFERRVGAHRVVNPGSVGLPFDGDPRAAYGLVHEDGAIERRRVPYDVAAASAAVLARFSDAPLRTRTLAILRTGRMPA